MKTSFKKTVSLILAFILIISAVPMASAETNAESYLTYIVNKNSEAIITECDQAITGSLTIPDTLGGYPVTKIDSDAFYYCQNLTSVTIPKTVIEIADWAFANCFSLKEVFILSEKVSLGDKAFGCCYDLESVVFAGDAEEITGSPFYGTYGVCVYAPKDGNLKKHAEGEYYFYKFTDICVSDFYLSESLSTSKVTLTWTKADVSIISGYKLYKYSSSSKKYSLYKTLSASRASYQLTSLKSATYYKFKIVPYVKFGGKTYTCKEDVLGFRTMGSSSAISKINNKLSDGFVASIKTVEKKYSTLNAYTSYTTYNNNWAFVSDISQFEDNKGNFCIAYSDKDNKYVYIRAYKSDLTQTYSRKISKTYPLLGGVACDKNGYFYIVWGKADNSSESSNVITMAISKYSNSGKLIKTAKFKSSDTDTKIPFDAGNCDIAINNGVLVCNYAREMYSGHQSNHILAVNTSTMKSVSGYYNYVSHSFDQRIIFDKYGAAWYANHGDAYPRGFDIESSNGKYYTPFHFYADESAMSDMFVLNVTKAYLGGIAETSSGIVLVGSSVKGLKESEYNSQASNLFIMYVDSNKTMQGGKSRRGICVGTDVTDTGIKWLTSYSSTDAYRPQIVKTDNDKLVVLWETKRNGEYKNTYYMILSGNGQVIQKATKIKDARLNSCEQPIYKNGYIYWATCDDYSDGSKLQLHKLNINKLAFDKSTLTVKNLKVSSKTKTSTTIKWSTVSNADGYYVYRYNSSKKAYTKIATLDADETKYKISNPKKTTYAVRAFKVVDSTRYIGAYSKIKLK